MPNVLHFGWTSGLQQAPLFWAVVIIYGTCTCTSPFVDLKSNCKPVCYNKLFWEVNNFFNIRWINPGMYLFTVVDLQLWHHSGQAFTEESKIKLIIHVHNMCTKKIKISLLYVINVLQKWKIIARRTMQSLSTVNFNQNWVCVWSMYMTVETFS